MSTTTRRSLSLLALRRHALAHWPCPPLCDAGRLAFGLAATIERAPRWSDLDTTRPVPSPFTSW